MTSPIDPTPTPAPPVPHAEGDGGPRPVPMARVVTGPRPRWFVRLWWWLARVWS